MKPGLQAVARRAGIGGAAVALAVGLAVAPGSPAAAAGEWCNNAVCIKTFDTSNYIGRVEVSVWTQNRAGRVNAHVWTTNGYSAWTHSENVGAFRTYRGWVYPQRFFPDQTRLCAEGWKDGRSVGLPCVTIVR